jgi:threonine dehydrogenase-like Zn-dependent dehydrogenase
VPSGHVRVRIVLSGICGSDVHGYIGNTGRRDIGVIMGHEVSGIVDEAADDVKDMTQGQRVIVQPTIFCGACEYCKAGRTQHCENKTFLGVFSRHGGFAEYVSVPAQLIYPLPDDVSFEKGALVEPMAVSKCAVDKITDYQNKTVLVVGSGTIGLLAIAVLKQRGAKMIIASDLSNNRLEAAKKLGADAVLNPKETDPVAAVRSLTGDVGVDVSIEAVGAGKPVETALTCLKPCGESVWIGTVAPTISLNMQSIVTREITVYGAFTYSHTEYGETLDMIRNMDSDVESIISKTLPIEEAPEIIARLADGSDTLIKTMIAF